MIIKKFKFSMLGFLSLLAIAAFQSGCLSDGTNAEREINDAIEADEELAEDFNKAKQVFYSLPSPIETAMLMKRAGAKYNEEYLNTTDNIPNYTTNKSMALNLGVYSADLSFSSMFDQSQAAIKYLSATKKLAEELGILNAVDKSIIDRMEANVNNRDSLMEIISETFMNSNSFLKENDRAETAAIILVGGWVEGLYIATQIAKATEQNSELIERIVDQRLSLATLISLLEEYEEDDENVASLLPNLREMKGIYDKVQISSSGVEVKTDEQSGKTTISSKSESSISPEIFEELCVKSESLRNKIVNG
ncbi:MAG: hypothetical protein KJ607_13650 [Bacteroidetes bacterium]|nr:hypothetical protein [Bacteroidota bacterium]